MSVNYPNPVLREAGLENPRSNVFLMMAFRETQQHKDMNKALSTVLAQYSLNAIRADFKHWSPHLWENVQFCADAACYGIGVFETISDPDLSHNVILELGYMLGQGKPCLVLKEASVRALPSDLIGRLYRSFDANNIRTTMQDAVRQWLRDLGIAKKADERLLIYASSGGTCRCAMAKAITQRLLLKNPPNYILRAESMAVGNPGLPGASSGARSAIKQLFGEDLLA